MRYPVVAVMLMAALTVCAQGSGFTFNYSGPTQIIVGPSCEAPLNWGHPNTPTVTSNLPGGVIVSFTIYSISGGYAIGDLVPGGSTVTVFYQALDNFGNTALFGFSINFVDNIPPVFDPLSLPPANITVTCSSNLPPPAAVEATDNCDNENVNLTITYTQTGTVQPCGGGTITRRWVADDDLGNKSTFTQVITVTPDVTPPVIANTLQNGMAPCSTAMAAYSTWLNTQRANFTATDAGCGVMTLSDNAPSPAIITEFCGAIDVTFTAKDNCNNTSSVVRTFTITNNVPPVITLPAENATGNCSQPNIQVLFTSWLASHGGATATDDCSGVLWTTYPPNPSLADTCNAAIEVLFIAGDGCNNFDTTAASFTVTDMTPPNITAQATTRLLGCTTASLDSLLTDWLTKAGESAATDLCTPSAQLAKGFAISGDTLTLEGVLDAWADSLAAGCRDGVVINGIGINNVKGYIPVTFLWADKCGNAAGSTGYFGITDNGRPMFASPPQDTGITCAQGMGWETLFLDWYTTAGFANVTDACSAVTLSGNITADSAMHYLAAALDTACAQGAAVTITFTATDECGNISTTTPSATFALSDTLPPVLLQPAIDLMIGCSGDPQGQLEGWLDDAGGAAASDGCGDITWTFQWTEAGQPMTGSPGTGPYPQIGNAGCDTSITIVFAATDPCLNVVRDTAIATRIDTIAPSITLATDTLHLSCTEPVPADAPPVSDDCDPAPMITFQDSVSTDTCTGRAGTIVRTWQATDACGNASSVTIVYITLDTIAPAFDLPQVSGSGCEPDSLALENVSDNCDPAPAVTWSDEFTGGVCEKTLMRTWRVTDACGNSTTALQVIPLSDDTPPVIITSPGDVTFSCDPSMPDLQATYGTWRSAVEVADGCSVPAWFIGLAGSFDPTDTMTWPGTPLPGAIEAPCGMDTTLQAILVAYDQCGNSTSVPISFTIADTVAPVIQDCPARLEFPANDACEGAVSVAQPEVIEICNSDNLRWRYVLDGGDTISVGQGFAFDTILPAGVHALTWLAIDCAGLTATCETEIAVFNEDALVINCPGDTSVFTGPDSCQATLSIMPPAITQGDCSGNIAGIEGFIQGDATPAAFTFTGVDDAVDIAFAPGMHIVYLVARDSTGDADTCRYIVNVIDTIPPVIECRPDTVVISPSGLDTIHLSNLNVPVNIIDGCGTTDPVYDPAFVTCEMQGQTIPLTITVTDPSGNTAECETTLLVETTPLIPTWLRGLCEDTLRLFAALPDSPAVNWTYAWTGPNGFSSDLADPVIPEADSSDSGTYVLTVTGPTGCTATGHVEVLVNTFNAPIITATDDTLCAGVPIELQATPYSGDVTYQWYLAANDSLLAITATSMLVLSDVGPGEYGFYATATQDTCSTDPGPVTFVHVDPVPVSEIADLPAILCTTDTLFLAPSTLLPDLLYAWSGPGGYMSNEATPPGIPATEIGSPGLFTLVTSSDRCNGSPDSVLITVQPTPAPPQLGGDTLACEGGSFTLHASGAATSYVWLDPQGIAIPGTDTLQVSPAMLAQAGSWRALAIINGCPGDTSAGFEVSIDTGIVIDIVAPLRACAGETITLAVMPQATGTYAWSGPGGFASTDPTPDVEAMPGTYTVTVLTATGCEATDTHDIAVDVQPSITAVLTGSDTCVDGITPIILYVVSQPAYDPAYTYQWQGPSGFTVQDSSIVLTESTAAASGVYSVVIENGACASDTASIELVLRDIPAAPVIEGITQYCDGDTIRLLIGNPVAGTDYTWTSADTTLTLQSPGTLVIPNATDAWSGAYAVTAIGGGCTSAPASVDITVNESLAAAVITAPSLICEGDTLFLSATLPAGATASWTGPGGWTSTEPAPFIHPFTAGAAGAYTVTYALGDCEAPMSAPHIVDLQGVITPPMLTGDITAICLDAPVPVDLCIDPTTATAGAIYTLWLNDQFVLGGPTPDSCFMLSGAGLIPGVNNLSVVASLNGCTSDPGEAYILQGDNFPAQMADAGLSMTYCPDEPFTLEGSDPAPGTGLWTSSDPGVVFSDPTDPNTQVNGLPSGTYTFQWTLSFASCTNYSSDIVQIEILRPPTSVDDTLQVDFGRTTEFIVTLNDSIGGIPYTLEIIQPPLRGNALHAGNGVFRYSPNVGYVGPDSMVYRICAADCPEACSEAVVRIQVGDESDCFVPTLFTPNGDGVNDVLIIPCLETTRYPDNAIKVFNEWGGLVFSAAPYGNDWTGTHDGKALPVGTYFYIMDFGDGSAPKRTFLVLER